MPAEIADGLERQAAALTRLHEILDEQLALIEDQVREISRLEERCPDALRVLADLRASRVYRLMRALGRWGGLERDIRRVLE
jgi:hypothetical protein